MNTFDIQSQLRAMIARLARIDADFRSDADVFRELGLESAAALDLLLQIEEDFDVAIDDEAFGNTRTLEQMTALVVGLRDAVWA
jgi:acyl carrier protein